MAVALHEHAGTVIILSLWQATLYNCQSNVARWT